MDSWSMESILFAAMEARVLYLIRETLAPALTRAVHERFTRRLLGELPDDPKNG